MFNQKNRTAINEIIFILEEWKTWIFISSLLEVSSDAIAHFLFSKEVHKKYNEKKIKKYNEELCFKYLLTMFFLIVGLSVHIKYQIALETKLFTSPYRGIEQ